MRKLAAILLCGIFFFNWMGYRLVNQLMQKDATTRLDARLDQQQYNEDQLIAIKVPVTDLAYYNNSATFERSNGQIEINGIPYRYVKCRIYDDSLEMLCIPNQSALALRQSGDNYFKGLNDFGQQQGAKPGSHPGAHKVFLSDPYIGMEQVCVGVPPRSVALRGNSPIAELPSLPLPTAERPPADLA